MVWFRDSTRHYKGCWSSLLTARTSTGRIIWIHASTRITSKHELSKYTPFKVMLGRPAVLPVDLNTAAHQNEPTEMQSFSDEEIEASMEERRTRLDSVKANNLISQRKQKRTTTAIKHPQPLVYAIGTLVWKKDFPRNLLEGNCGWVHTR